MASATKQTMYRRLLRKKQMGRDRKAQNENYGSTPKFPIHTADAHANAPAAQLPKKSE